MFRVFPEALDPCFACFTLSRSSPCNAYHHLFQTLYISLPLSLAAHSWHWRHGGFKGVEFAGKVAFAFIFDERDGSAADDVGRPCELDVRGAISEPISAQAGEGDAIFPFSA